MLITLEHFFLLIPLITLHAAEFYVASGLDCCGCPISVKIVHRYSPVSQFVIWGPISASISNMTIFSLSFPLFASLHLVLSFHLGVSCIFQFVPLYKNPTVLVFASGSDMWDTSLYIYSWMSLLCTLLFSSGEWRSNFINVLFYFPTIIYNFCLLARDSISINIVGFATIL